MSIIIIKVKYLYSILLILTLAWFVSVLLTQHLVQREALNILKIQESGKSQFTWDFKSKNDFIESNVNVWDISNGGLTMAVGKQEKQYLSLNFSGSAINSLHYNKLIIETNTEMQGNLTLEFKTDLEDNFFYYSPKLPLSGKYQIIDLEFSWRGQNTENTQKTTTNWGASLNKISSLVLYFENYPNGFSIKNIQLPVVNNAYDTDKYDVDCQGQITDKSKISLTNQNRFILNEFCLFPSTYMWLKQKIKMTYPGSVLQLSNSFIVPSSKSPINIQSNLSLTLIYSILYGFLCVIFLFIYRLTSTFQVKAKKEEPWYKWLFKKILMKKLLPYNLLVSYWAILGPTLFLLLIMAYFQPPSINILKNLPMYFLWALFQQFILGYVLAERVFYNRTQNKLIASLFAGLVFSLIHMPSTTLMLATFIGGFWWSLAWLLFKRFIPLAVSHAVLALMFYHAIPNQYLYSAKVLQWFWS